MLSKDIDFSNVDRLKKHTGGGLFKTTYCITFVMNKGKNITKPYSTEANRDASYMIFLNKLRNAKA